MNPNVILDEYAPLEYDVFIHSTYVGNVYYDDVESDSWAAIDVRDDVPTLGFETLDEAVYWLVAE